MHLWNVFTYTSVIHPRLVLVPMTTAFGSKRQCSTVVEKSNYSVDSSQSTKKSRVSGVGEGKPARQGTKAALGSYTEEVAHTGLARWIRSAQAFASLDTPKPLEFFDITTERATKGVQALSEVLLESTVFHKKVAKDNDVKQLEITSHPKVISPKEQASVEEWASWHKALRKLKYSIANEARVLSFD
ncbi:hypothetical protein D8674_000180 [Pyrus ussuriensis x Pyrus communis]|uniref:Uncharacterized protein n=1 Tax=Pyrus ussuriensis x Pyrus communis TaxID=2448454 RepID=A0A5N5F837_9ROSA|nr:hypothetical protein D8674_000180 [Pyrus ussuriensis x Pyrus communis]